MKPFLAILLLALTGCTTAPRAPFFARITGTSMEPMLHTGDTGLLLPYRWDALKPGMVVGRWYAGKLFIHRLKARTAHGWTTQGLNEPHPDFGVLTPSQFAGVWCVDGLDPEAML